MQCQKYIRRIASVYAALLVVLPALGTDVEPLRDSSRRTLAQDKSAPDPANCQFGTTPGTWIRSEWPSQEGKGSDQHTYSRLDDQPQSIWLNSYKDDGGVPFGSARVSVDPACPLENLVLPFLTGGKSMDPLTILFFGDSLDAQMLDYVCMEYIRRGGDGWFAFLRNHNQVNYCHLPNGLTLIQKYAMRGSKEEDENTLQLVRAFFNGDDSFAINNRRDEEPEDNYKNRSWEVPILTAREPDLIVAGGTYWPLHHFAGEQQQEDMLPLLPVEQVNHFVATTTHVIERLKGDFPKSTVVVRNSPEITTRCDTGSHVSGRHRTWGLRTYVDQLNNGVVVAARMGGADLVDVKQAADAWQPEQMTTDGVHPRAWFQMELLNVYLNIAKGLRRQKKAAGEGSRRR